jgi:hypothetical protein
MPADHDHEPPQRRCPVCWTPFAVGPRTPNKRYCCPACRVQAWRRRSDRLRAQALPDTIARAHQDPP